MVEAEVREIARAEIEAWRKQDWLVSRSWLKRGFSVVAHALLLQLLLVLVLAAASFLISLASY